MSIINVARNLHLKERLKKRLKLSHKGQNGRVLVIGGSEEYVGSPILAGLAALVSLRSGADLVTIAAPEKVAWVANTISPDIMTKKLKGEFLQKSHVRELLKFSENFDSIIIGIGLGTRKETSDFVNGFVRNKKKDMIIDADAIKLLKRGTIDNMENCIITPHHRELEYFLINYLRLKKIAIPENQSEKIKFIKEKCRGFLKENAILLKGPVDIIFFKDAVILNKTGNSLMTVGGTGDVLSGIAGAFLAQKNDIRTSAYYACYINGKAGDNLKKIKGSIVATDLLKEIPFVLKQLKQ